MIHNEEGFKTRFQETEKWINKDDETWQKLIEQMEELLKSWETSENNLINYINEGNLTVSSSSQYMSEIQKNLKDISDLLDLMNNMSKVSANESNEVTRESIKKSKMISVVISIVLVVIVILITVLISRNLN